MDVYDKSQLLHQLSQRVQAIEDQSSRANAAVISSGWAEVDEALATAAEPSSGGFQTGAIHEFVAADSAGRAAKGASVAPLCVLVHLARQAAAKLEGKILWIGRACWPNPQFLAAAGLLERSLFVEARSEGDRLWAIELAMRCPAVACIAGDAEGFKLPATRRLELAGRECGALVLLARPPRERTLSSAASTRWQLRRRVSDSTCPAWTLELLRCKGRQLAHGGRWPLEWDCAKGVVTVSAAMVDRLSPAAATSAPRRSASG